MVISRSRTVAPHLPSFVLDGAEVERFYQLRILGVTLDHLLSFETHIRSVVSSASRRLVIFRKTLGVFDHLALTFRCFWCYLLPVLEYYTAFWMSAADCHLRFLDRVVSRASAMCGRAIPCDLWHRLWVVFLCLFYKIGGNDCHPVGSLFLAARRAPIRVTRRGLVAHTFTFEVPRVRTSQFSRFFMPDCVRGWNSFDGFIFESEDDGEFKSLINCFLVQSL